ncbi:MAG: SDR family NAD(P)-dependent oxidoreductase [Janthinobacterium lividum]
MKRLENKVALVTGAGGAIGRGISLTYAAEGAVVACVDLDRAHCEETVSLIRAAGGKAAVYTTDISDRLAVGELVASIEKDHGGLDIVVNNAMWIQYDPIAEVQESVVDRMFGVGLKAIIWITQAAVPAMERRGGGSIVNISSIAAIRGSKNRIVYCTVKGGVTAMTLECAVELGPLNIRVNAIAPGAVLNPGSAARLGAEAIQLRLDTTPMGRLPVADDMAGVALFLASDDSRFVTGTMIPVDGGRRIVS